MSKTDQSMPPAWEPLTPRGVAGFAGASFRRLLLVQLVVAMGIAGLTVWLLRSAWFPAVRAAIAELPPEGEIAAQQLDWPGPTPAKLAGNRFLEFTVDLDHGGRLDREAQLQVEFGRKDARVVSKLGYAVFAYPPGWRMAFNRPALEPWWGAWQPWMLAGAAVAAFAWLMAVWTLLATLYCLPVWLISFFQNRDLKLLQSWRVAGAALMPGALFMAAGMLAYGFGWVDILRLGGMAVLHVLIGWLYLFISPLFLPRHPAAPGQKANPFAAPKT